MAKNILIVLLAVVAIGSLAFGLQQRKEFQELRKELTIDAAPPEKAPDQKVAQRPKAEKTTPLAEDEKLQYEKRIAELQSMLEVSQAQPLKEETGEAKQQEAPLAGLAKMMKNPAMKDMIRVQQKSMIDLSHKSLFEYLELSDEDLKSFKEMLIDKQMAVVDLSMGMMDNTLSPEEKKKTAEQIAAITASWDEKIKAFLGDEEYKVYEEFGDTQQERMQVTMFKGALSGEQNLSEQQEHDLIRAMYDERKAFPLSIDFNDQANIDPGNFTKVALDTYFVEYEKLQEKYLVRAEGILSAEQFIKFKENQVQQQNMTKMGLQMAAQMFGKPEAK